MLSVVKTFKDLHIISAPDNEKADLRLARFTSAEDEERKMRLIAITLPLIFFAGLGIFIFRYIGGENAVNLPPWKKYSPIYVGYIGTLIVLGLMVTYYFAFRFYEDIFYL